VALEKHPRAHGASPIPFRLWPKSRCSPGNHDRLGNGIRRAARIGRMPRRGIAGGRLERDAAGSRFVQSGVDRPCGAGPLGRQPVRPACLTSPGQCAFAAFLFRQPAGPAPGTLSRNPGSLPHRRRNRALGSPGGDRGNLSPRMACRGAPVPGRLPQRRGRNAAGSSRPGPTAPGQPTSNPVPALCPLPQPKPAATPPAPRPGTAPGFLPRRPFPPAAASRTFPG
jgi:hypothetical protein